MTALPIRLFNLVILTVFDRVHNYLCNVELFHDDRVLLCGHIGSVLINLLAAGQLSSEKNHNY